MSPSSALPIGLMGFALMASALANRAMLETAAPAPRPVRVAAVATLQAALSLVERAGGRLCLVRGD